MAISVGIKRVGVDHNHNQYKYTVLRALKKSKLKLIA